MGLLVGLSTMGDAQRRYLVVDKAPHGLGMLDAVAIHADPLSHLCVPTEVKAEGAQTHFPGGPEAVRLAARHPQGRMGLLHGLGDDRARRDLVKAPVVRSEEHTSELQSRQYL